MAINPTSLPTNRAAGSTGHIADSNAAYAAINSLTGEWNALVARVVVLEGLSGLGANFFFISGASTPRVNPTGGGALPSNASVFWLADTKPAAMLDDRDVWYVPAS